MTTDNATATPAQQTTQPRRRRARRSRYPTDHGELQAYDARLNEIAQNDPGSYRWGPEQHATTHLRVREALAKLDEGDAGDADDDDEGADADLSDTTDTAEEDSAAKAEAGDDEAELIEVNLETPSDVSDYIEAMPDDHWSREDPLAGQYAEFLHEQGMPKPPMIRGSSSSSSSARKCRRPMLTRPRLRRRGSSQSGAPSTPAT